MTTPMPSMIPSAAGRQPDDVGLRTEEDARSGEKFPFSSWGAKALDLKLGPTASNQSQDDEDHYDIGGDDDNNHYGGCCSGGSSSLPSDSNESGCPVSSTRSGVSSSTRSGSSSSSSSSSAYHVTTNPLPTLSTTPGDLDSSCGNSLSTICVADERSLKADQKRSADAFSIFDAGEELEQKRIRKSSSETAQWKERLRAERKALSEEELQRVKAEQRLQAAEKERLKAERKTQFEEERQRLREEHFAEKERLKAERKTQFEEERQRLREEHFAEKERLKAERKTQFEEERRLREEHFAEKERLKAERKTQFEEERQRLREEHFAKKERSRAERKAQSERLRREEWDERLRREEWYQDQTEIIKRLQQKIEEVEDGSTKPKLQELLRHQRDLLQIFNEEADGQKKINLNAGLDYCGELLIKIIEEAEDGETKQQDKWLKTENKELKKIAAKETSILTQRKYLGNLQRRKKRRGHSGSEAYIKQWKLLQEVKEKFTALKAEQHKSIEDEFSDDAVYAKEYEAFIRAIADGSSDDIPGKFGGFTKDSAALVAGEKVNEVLELAAQHNGVSVDDILPPGMNLQQFLEIDKDGKEELDKLKYLALEKAMEKGKPLLDKGEIEQKDIDCFAELSFLTCLQILTYHDDIVDSLVDKKAGVIRHPKSNKLLIFACIPNLLKSQFCIGSIVFEGLDLEDFERDVHIEGKYVIQLFGGDEYLRLYDVKENSIERNSFFVETTDNLLTFICTLRRDRSFQSEKKYSRRKKWSLHRLEHVVLFNLGLGMNNRKWFRDYFDLEDNETFEQKVSYYKYDPDAAEKRRERLKIKGWENISQAVQCDTDHLLGRMHMWMNASIFAMPCSHSWNQCMAHVRKRMGNWGFAFASIKYNGGN